MTALVERMGMEEGTLRWARAHRRMSEVLPTSGLLLLLLLLLLPATAPAAITTFDSPLTVPATLDTAENLSYQGTNTSVLPSAWAPNGVVHTFHYGADAALWNVALTSGQPSSPATGQALKVSLEGCAKPAAGGPAPLTQIHFQDLSPLPGGGARVNLTSQPFDIPICGHNGASGSTVSTYAPINLCVARGDYVALNEEGGFVERSYQSGVPYEVLGARTGSTADSFIKGDGTGNNASMRSSESTSMDGFASNQNEELMLQVTLGTGRDATHVCAGGSAGLAPALAPIRVGPQTDGVNRSRVASVAIYCRPTPGCHGVATLTAIGRDASYGRAGIYGSSRFSLAGNKTAHVPIRVSPRLIQVLRAHRRGVAAALTAVVAGKTFTQTIVLRIF